LLLALKAVVVEAVVVVVAAQVDVLVLVEAITTFFVVKGDEAK
jgi:hypothetical protein